MIKTIFAKQKTITNINIAYEINDSSSDDAGRDDGIGTR